MLRYVNKQSIYMSCFCVVFESKRRRCDVFTCRSKMRAYIIHYGWSRGWIIVIIMRNDRIPMNNTTHGAVRVVTCPLEPHRVNNKVATRYVNTARYVNNSATLWRHREIFRRLQYKNTWEISFKLLHFCFIEYITYCATTLLCIVC